MTRQHLRDRRQGHRLLAVVAVLALVLVPSTVLATPAQAGSGYQQIAGAGSTWSANAIRQWTTNVKNTSGIPVNFNASGSSDGRTRFANGTVDFAVSEIPFGLQDGNTRENIPTRGFAYMPIVAGGTAFMYNLKINGQQVRSLRLSGDTVTKIFTGVITVWNDPAIKADNPGLTLPGTRIVPVVRSDGSGTSAQFTAWMLSQHGGLWNDFCRKVNRNPCTQTSNYPVPPGSSFQGKAGSDGVSGFVRQPQAEGSITYVEYSYAKNANFPVAKVLNKAGFYTLPTAQNVAVGLLGAQIETANKDPKVFLTQKLGGVYGNPDPRTYPLSSYSYIVVPTKVEANFSEDKGKTLGDFAYYFLCAGQAQADPLGYSPLPKNLVEAGLDQVRKIPGVDPQNINLNRCNNPTFSSTGENLLAKNAPQPAACDKKGQLQCGTAAEGSPLPAAPGDTGGGGAGGGDGTGGAGGAADGGASGGGGSSGAGGAAGDAAADGTAGTTGDGTTTGTDDSASGTAGDGTTADGTTADGTTGDGTAADPAAGAAVDLDGDGIPDAVGADGGTAAGGAPPAAIPLQLASTGGWQPSYTFVLLTVLALVAVMLVPPLLARRLSKVTR